MNTIEMNFKPELEDLVKIERIFPILEYKIRVVGAVIIAVVTGSYIVSFQIYHLPSNITVLIAFLIYILATGIVFSSAYFVKERVKRYTKKAPSVFEPVMIEINNESITFRRTNDTYKFQWFYFDRVYEMADYFIVVSETCKKCFEYIPKRIFPDEASVISFRAFLSEKFRKYSDLSESRINQEPVFSDSPIPRIVYFLTIILPFLIMFLLGILEIFSSFKYK